MRVMIRSLNVFAESEKGGSTGCSTWNKKSSSCACKAGIAIVPTDGADASHSVSDPGETYGEFRGNPKIVGVEAEAGVAVLVSFV
jgi:hypothetical protein